MTRWLGPLAYFGAVFGVEGEAQAQPGIMGMVASGLGGCSASPKGAARAEIAAQGISEFRGTLETAQQPQTVDMGIVACGEGSVEASLSAIASAAPADFSYLTFWCQTPSAPESRRLEDAALAAQGCGRMVASALRFVSAGMVASGSGAIRAEGEASRTPDAIGDEETEVLALLIALDLAA